MRTLHFFKKNFILLVSALLAFIGIVFNEVWFFVSLALMGLVYVTLFKTTYVRTAVYKGLVFGFTASLGSLWWMWGAYPMDDWAGTIPRYEQIVFIGVGWILTAVVFAIPVGVLTATLKAVKEKAYALITFPFLLVVIEGVRMWAYTLYTYGENALVGPHFSIATLAYSLTESYTLLQVASGGGVYNLTFLLGLIAVLPSIVILSIKEIGNIQVRICTAITAVLFIGAVSFGLVHIPEAVETQTTTDILLLSSKQYFEKVSLERASLYQNIIRDLDQVPDVIVFPEGEHIETVFPEIPNPREAFKELVRNQDVLIIGNQQNTQDSKNYSTTFFDTALNGTIATQNKILLAPFGEYMPAVAPVVFFGSPREHLYISPYFVTKGDTLSVAEHNGVTFGALACSELLSPHLYRTLAAQKNADILFNISDPSWFGSTHFFDRMLQMSRVHAVQNRVYFLTAAVETSAFALNPKGEIIARGEHNTTAGLVVTIPTQ